MGTDNKFGKTICSICYEDLKPIVEDLQVISICGHVFHELCLQQWFEYCPDSKKCTCPVCKQRCVSSNVSRLYFQSIGDQNDLIPSQKPKGPDVEDPEVLRSEVKILELKVSRLNSVLESQGKEIKEINEELCLCKDRTREEASLKDEALRQKVSIERLLHSKSQELDKATLECLKMKERNMALAKELASLKLVSDLNLDEDEILKFASLGNGANNNDTIDVLRKSLVVRNKNYTELMSKCNILGREKARSLEKLEKAKGKINKLKTRVQELETVVELKDNEALRALKVSKKTSQKGDILKAAAENNYTSLSTKNVLQEDRREQCSALNINSDGFSRVTNHFSCSTKRENFNAINNTNANNATANYAKEGVSTNSQDKDMTVVQKENTSRYSSSVLGLSSPHLQNQTTGDVGQKSILSRLEATPIIDIDDDVTLIANDSAHVQPTLNITKNPPSPASLSKPGDACFSGGVFSPDGTSRYLGKWCKRGQKGSNSGDIITVGADGRGGRVKVLRSANQSAVNDQENVFCAKRLKSGAKTSIVQPQGCLQIEHFFGRVSH